MTASTMEPQSSSRRRRWFPNPVRPEVPPGRVVDLDTTEDRADGEGVLASAGSALRSLMAPTDRSTLATWSG